MNACEVKGYNKLVDKHQKLFGAFLFNFRNSWESEIKPISIKYMIRESCLKFVFEVNGKRDWLRVVSATNWY